MWWNEEKSIWVQTTTTHFDDKKEAQGWLDRCVKGYHPSVQARVVHNYKIEEL